MHDVADEMRDSSELLEEIGRLRADNARLQRQVQELDELAHHDPLCPAVNRRGMMRELEKLIARKQRHGTDAALLFVDLDGLKVLNDTRGHLAGDAALVHVAEQLVAGTRSMDTIARLGGDEFCVLLDEADEASAIATAERLIDAIASEDFLYDGLEMPLSVAIGVTMVQGDDTPSSALVRADQAMYRDKADAA